MTEETTTPPEAATPAEAGAQPSPQTGWQPTPAAADDAPTSTASGEAASTETTPAAAAPEQPRQPDLSARVAELERQVADLEAQVASEREAASDYMRRWQQSQADFSNFRRRARQEQEQAQRILGLEATARILPALDSLERAFTTLPPTLRRYTWIEGIALIHLQLQQGLASLGVEPLAVEPGHEFNPQQHEAIGEIETAEHPAGHVAAVVQRGYAAGGILLRPALVQVARAPSAQAPNTSATSNTDDATRTSASEPTETPSAFPSDSPGTDQAQEHTNG